MASGPRGRNHNRGTPDAKQGTQFGSLRIPEIQNFEEAKETKKERGVSLGSGGLLVLYPSFDFQYASGTLSLCFQIGPPVFGPHTRPFMLSSIVDST